MVINTRLDIYNRYSQSINKRLLTYNGLCVIVCINQKSKAQLWSYHGVVAVGESRKISVRQPLRLFFCFEIY